MSIVKKVSVIDSGVANLASVMAALKRLDIEAEVTGDAGTIRDASHVILPGVGAASAAMAQLEERKLGDVIRGLTQPVLGICLGMQLLFKHSAEGQGCECLGIIDATIAPLRAGPDMPVPHMGWNQIAATRAGHPFLRDIDDGSYVYFVHSFAAPVGDYTLASCDYGVPFTAVAAHKNFFGCQFHPERSGAAGSRILKNFVDM